jgi:outer membrane biosynthesis protein TonB
VGHPGERSALNIGNIGNPGNVKGLAAHVVAVKAALAFLVTTVGIVSREGAAQATQTEGRPTLNGAWAASPLTESWTVAEWGSSCGPKPAPKGAPGGAVQIREQGGELSIIGAGRAFTTAECWEQMPGLSRTSHSQSGNGRSWRTRCNTAPNDPRRAAVVTTVQATDTSITLSETGQYQFNVEGASCVAAATRSRSFSITQREGEGQPAPSASASAAPSAEPSAEPSPPEKPKPPEPRPPPRCGGPAGEPARIEVTPSRKLLRPGERFTFRAAVLDAAGCPTSEKATWAIAPGPLAGKASVEAGGAVTVAADAAVGKLEVTATALGKTVTVTVDVARPEDYEALLADRSPADGGEADEAAVAVIATGGMGGRTSVAEDLARERKLTFVAIVAVVAAVLGFIGLVLMRRGRTPDSAPESAGTPPEEGEDVVDVGAEGGHAAHGDDDERRAPEATPSLAASPVGQTGPGGIGTPALGAAAPAPTALAGVKKPPRGKICPTCGERYPAEAQFCGKDATVLVPLN